jgi:hypothetical protein
MLGVVVAELTTSQPPRLSPAADVRALAGGILQMALEITLNEVAEIPHATKLRTIDRISNATNEAKLVSQHSLFLY